MSSLCTHCASRGFRLARSAVAARPTRSGAGSRRLESAPAITPWTARGLHSATTARAIWTAGSSVSPARRSGSAVAPLARSRFAVTGRRFIACPAEPPTDPSEDFEPAEEELQPGEALEMHLTDAAIKVSRHGRVSPLEGTLCGTARRDLGWRLVC